MEVAALQDKNSKIKVCSVPFRFCEIHPFGKTYPCCPSYCKCYSFGSVKFKSFEKVWNSKEAKLFREKILNGDHSLCNRKICKAYQGETVEDIKRKYYDKKGNVKAPDELKMCWDIECNAACITCRDKFIKNGFKREIIAKLINFNLASVFKKIKIFNCSGCGDPFGSSYCRKLLKDTASKNKDLKFHICSNGVLMSHDMCKKLGIDGRITDVTLSIHAATKETYDKIVRYGNFNKVLENLSWLSNEKKLGRIGEISAVFVINDINFKEIPDFINLAEQYNIVPEFSCFRYWGTEYGKDYDKVAVWKAGHPQHQEFLKVINNPIVQANKDRFEGTVLELFAK